MESPNFRLATDVGEMNLKTIHTFLSNSYWAPGIPLETIRRSMENSLCFGVFCDERQVAFARVVTDRATFAYLCDVFVVEDFQFQGVGKWLMQQIMAHRDLQGLRRFCLATRDAHTLYAQFGFQALAKPESMMEIIVPNIYQKIDAVELEVRPKN